MEGVFERGDDAEVAASPAQGPEEVLVLLLTGEHDLAVGRDDLGGQQVVAGEAVLPREVADAAAQREAGDAGRADNAAGRGQPLDVGGVVEARPRAAAAGARRLGA